MSPERAITLLRRPRPELMRRPWADGPTSVLRRPRCGRSRVKSEPIEFPSASWQPHIPLDSRLCLALVLSNSSLLCTIRSGRDCALPTCRRLFHLTNQRANELIRWCCLLRLSCSSRLSSTAPPPLCQDNPRPVVIGLLPCVGPLCSLEAARKSKRKERKK